MEEKGPIELGVFLPIGNNGFLISRTSPQYAPTFDLNKRIAQLAESMGFAYVFSMSKWRGFGGATKFWDTTLESLSLMTGLAAVTTRIGIIATITPVLFAPPVAAKMAATIDDISNGRLLLNVVTGSSLDEYEQMGPLPPDYGVNRYRYADEWLRVVKRLWTEESVDFDGEWFHLRDCRSSPRPRGRPHPPIVCAGSSEEGMRFTAREGDYGFIGGVTIDHTRRLALRLKEIAAEHGRSIKAATTVLPIIGATDAEARARWDAIQAGADREALANLAETFGRKGRESARNRIAKLEREVSFAGRLVVGAPSTIADAMEELARVGDVDSIQLLFPDYIEGLNTFHAEVAPLLRQRGLVA